RAHAQFPTQYLQRVRQFHQRPVRQNDRQVAPGPMSCSIRDRQLRVELTMERRRAMLDTPVLDMLEQVLNRPLQRLRSSLGNDAVAVLSVHLEHDPSRPPVVLSNTFIFHKPAHADGPLVFWSAIKGLRVFDSLAELETSFNRWVRSADGQNDWL